MIILSFVFAPLNASATTAGQFDLDVMFVIDVSGSMRTADRDRLALTAANLFIDMCEETNSRAGYVMYSHVIVNQRGLTDLISFSDRTAMQREIDGADYGGDTDIALGLETALDILSRDRSYRTPVIILLGDGNTDLPSGPRTAADSLAALEAAKQNAARMGIPIYTIGFNYDGSLDEEAFNSIAAQTGGIPHSTRSAADLPGILRQIYGHLTGATSTTLTETATGTPQDVTFLIKDSSIYRTTITIMSNQPIRDLSLTMPDGRPARYATNADPNGRYTILTVSAPIAMGSWTLNFTGTRGDTVIIDLLSIYDLTLVLELPRPSAGQADFSWRAEDEDGSPITDQALLDALEPALHLRNNTTGTVYKENFKPGQTTMSLVLDAGDYDAYLEVNSYGILRTSNTQKFTVPSPSPPPPELPDAVTLNDNTYEVSLMTVFNAGATVLLSDVVTYTRDNLPFSVSVEDGEWSELVAFDYEGADESIALSALPTFGFGSSEMKVIVTDAYGRSVEFFISVSVFSGWILIFAGAALILIALTVIIIVKQKKKPLLNSPMSKLYIKMTLPPHVYSEPPPEAALTLPAVKGKKTLRELIDMNVSISEPYRIAFEPIGWFAGGTVFSAKTKSLLEIRVPSNPGYTVKLNRLAGRDTAEFDKNGGAEVIVGAANAAPGEYNEYVIIFGSAGSANDIYDFGNKGFSFDDTAITSVPNPRDGFWD